MPTAQRVPKSLAEIDPELAAVKAAELSESVARLAQKFAKPQRGPKPVEVTTSRPRQSNGWSA